MGTTVNMFNFGNDLVSRYPRDRKFREDKWPRKFSMSIFSNEKRKGNAKCIAAK